MNWGDRHNLSHNTSSQGATTGRGESLPRSQLGQTHRGKKEFSRGSGSDLLGELKV